MGARGWEKTETERNLQPRTQDLKPGLVQSQRVVTEVLKLALPMA
jgi:hypothetical protein